jgi:hypothetical protein
MLVPRILVSPKVRNKIFETFMITDEELKYYNNKSLQFDHCELTSKHEMFISHIILLFKSEFADFEKRIHILESFQSVRSLPITVVDKNIAQMVEIICYKAIQSFFGSYSVVLVPNTEFFIHGGKIEIITINGIFYSEEFE